MRRTVLAPVLLSVIAGTFLAAPQGAQDAASQTVRYTATIEIVKYVYGPAPLVARL